MTLNVEPVLDMSEIYYTSDYKNSTILKDLSFNH